MDTIIDQLLTCVIVRNEIKRDVLTSPAFPKSVTGIGHNRHERDLVGEIQFAQHSPYNVLREWMNADDDMWTPLLKCIVKESDAAAEKKLTSFRAKAIDRPIEIFHPALLMSQQPVV